MRRIASRATALAIVGCGVLAGCKGRTVDVLSAPDAGMTPPPPVRAEEPRQIHFTFTAPDAVTFDWRGSDPALRVWAKNVAPRTVEAQHPTIAPFSSAGPWQEAVVGGLLPGMDYQYEVGHPVRPTTSTFRTPPAPGATGFKFVAVGDIGAAATWPAAKVVHRVISLTDPAFVLALGDLTYANESGQADVDKHFDDVMVWSRRAAYMPVWGNHEWVDKRDDLRNYKGRFALPHAAASPGAPEAGCCGEDWYWFDYGAVRFITYPEPYSAETWPDWTRKAEPLFEEAQADRAIRFIVTAGHRPAYTSGHYGIEPNLRPVLDGLGKRFSKYVLNLSGHGHNYERTKPQSRVVHVTAGMGGKSLEHAATPCLFPDCKQPPWVAFRTIHHGFVKLTVRDDGIALEAVCAGAAPNEESIRCADGEIMDEALIAPEPDRGPPTRRLTARR